MEYSSLGQFSSMALTHCPTESPQTQCDGESPTVWPPRGPGMLAGLMVGVAGCSVSWPLHPAQANNLTSLLWTLWPGSWFNIKISSYQYRKSHCRDKTVIKPSYLHNGISYTGKMASLYWIRPSYLHNEISYTGKMAYFILNQGPANQISRQSDRKHHRYYTTSFSGLLVEQLSWWHRKQTVSSQLHVQRQLSIAAWQLHMEIIHHT